MYLNGLNAMTSPQMKQLTNQSCGRLGIPGAGEWCQPLNYTVTPYGIVYTVPSKAVAIVKPIAKPIAAVVVKPKNQAAIDAANREIQKAGADLTTLQARKGASPSAITAAKVRLQNAINNAMRVQGI